jgi:hypothetical protein
MIRLDNGAPQFITYEGNTYSGGNVPYAILQELANEANGIVVSDV